MTLTETLVDSLRATFRGPLVGPADPDYDTARSVWNAMVDKRPAVVARCTGPADVVAACDESATIPLAPGAESLNVAIAGAIALYEHRRGR